MAEKDKKSDKAAGQYSGVIKSQRLDESSKNKTPFVEFSVLVDKKLVPSSNSLEDLQTPFYRTIRMYLTPGTFAKADAGERLRVAGFQGEDLTTLEPSSPRVQNLTGNRIPIYHNAKDAYDWQISVKTFKERPSNPAVAAKLGNLFGQSSGPATTTQVASSPAPVASGNTETPSDEDLPF